MWYSIIPIAAMIFFSRKTVALWGIYVLVLICSVFVVGSFIPKEYFHSPTEKQLMVINIMTIVLSISFILFFIYYLNKINLIREIHLAERESVDEIDNYIEEEELESDKLDKLYLNILNYFVEKEPFCDPDYTITQLAKELQSNVKYISRIIKIKEDVNF
ncbi:hypothetical protein JGH11_19310, partial [Dysgonomonas sp. Marseille-P4677]|nr:hypothetical protein [Dysgonomonas sp. Marseille-P4677]